MLVCSDPYWPIVLVNFPPRVDQPWLEKMFADFDACFARRERYATLMDTTSVVEVPGAAMRREIGEWSKRIDAPTRRWSVAGGVVLTSALIRGTLTALHWLHPPAAPLKVTSTAYEGLAFLRERLDAERIPYPEAVAEYHASLRRPRAAAG